MVRNFSTSFTVFLLSLDFGAGLLAVYFAEVLRRELPYGVEAGERFFTTPNWFYAVIPIVWLIILSSGGAYSPRQTYRAYFEAMNVLRSNFTAALVMTGILYIFYRDYSRFQAAYLILLLGLFTVSLRAIIRLYFRFTGGRRYDSKRLLIVGTGNLAHLVARQVRSYAWTGLYLVGHVEDERDMPANAEQEKEAPLHILGNRHDLMKLVESEQIDEVIFATHQPDYQELFQLITQMYQKRVNVRLAPDIQELAYLTATVEQIDGLPLISLRDSVLTPSERILKRVFDFTISSISLIFVLPILGFIALLIRLESKGSPIFVQNRIGEGMTIFKMYKFRTMVQGAEAMQDAVNEYDEEGHIIHKTRNDPRVTRVGKFLRQSSLDELPQLINIWKGDMSLVGPRPELPWLAENYEDWQLKRFEVPQGLTGWWQINGRSETPMHLATEDDIYYIMNYSLLLDFLIMIRTPFVVFGGRGAF